jgi:dolichyl-phosphate beta-glucosyltransferase
MPPRISAIVPTYNEARRISNTLEEISKSLESIGEPYEILVVDNASSDSTPQSARRARTENLRVLVNARNEGKGYSVRRGMLEANGSWRFFIDADLSTPAEEIPRFWKLAREDEFGIIVGSRLAAGASVVRPQSLLRRLAGQACLSLTRAVIPQLPRDVFCGFKWFRSDVAEIVFQPQVTTGWLFDAEVLGRARQLGIRILEVPIHWENDPDSKLSMLKDFPAISLELIRIAMSMRKERASSGRT